MYNFKNIGYLTEKRRLIKKKVYKSVDSNKVNNVEKIIKDKLYRQIVS